MNYTQISQNSLKSLKKRLNREILLPLQLEVADATGKPNMVRTVTKVMVRILFI